MKPYVTWIAVCAALCLVGCPAKKGDCSARGFRLVGSSGDPLLGSFAGSLSWLQTGEDTSVQFTSTPLDTRTEGSTCGDNLARFEVVLTTADGAIDKTSVERWVVGKDGRVVPPIIRVPLDAEDLVDAGKLPDASGILDRNPEAVFELTLDGAATYRALLTVSSATDHLSVAMGSLQKVGP